MFFLVKSYTLIKDINVYMYCNFFKIITFISFAILLLDIFTIL